MREEGRSLSLEEMAMAMAASLAAHHHLAGGGLLPTPRASGRNGRSGITISMRAQVEAHPTCPNDVLLPWLTCFCFFFFNSPISRRESRAVTLGVGRETAETGESAVGGECGVAGNWYALWPN